MKHFEFTGETKTNASGITLFRIRCTVPFRGINVGDVGGWIEKAGNLSNDAWVFDDAEVFHDARISGDVQVSDNACIAGKARAYGNARIFDSATVCEEAWIYDNAVIYGNAGIYGNADIAGYAEVFGDAEVFDDAIVTDKARISSDAQIFDGAVISGDAEISTGAYIFNTGEYCCFQGFGRSRRTTTVFRTKNKELRIVCGCFFGTLDEFAAKVEQTHGDNQHGKVYKALIEVIKLRFAEE